MWRRDGFRLQERDRLARGLVQVGGNGAQRRRARVREKVREQPREPARLDARGLGELRGRRRDCAGAPGRGRMHELLLEKLEVEAHRVQGIPDLVREARRHLAELGAPLGLEARLLDAPRAAIEEDHRRGRRENPEERHDGRRGRLEVQLAAELLDTLCQHAPRDAEAQHGEVADGHLHVVGIRLGRLEAVAARGRAGLRRLHVENPRPLGARLALAVGHGERAAIRVEDFLLRAVEDLDLREDLALREPRRDEPVDLRLLELQDEGVARRALGDAAREPLRVEPRVENRVVDDVLRKRLEEEVPEEHHGPRRQEAENREDEGQGAPEGPGVEIGHARQSSGPAARPGRPALQR